MTEILRPIRPPHAHLILTGDKTREVHTVMPSCESPYRVYIYVSKTGGVLLRNDAGFYKYLSGVPDGYLKVYKKRLNGFVVGHYTCNTVSKYVMKDGKYDIPVDEKLASRVSYEWLVKYGAGKSLYFEHISDLVIYDEPRRLSEFVSDKTLTYNEWLNGIYSGGKGSKGNYNSYLNVCSIKRAPQSFCYVREREVLLRDRP